jgi:hypothetical protein
MTERETAAEWRLRQGDVRPLASLSVWIIGLSVLPLASAQTLTSPYVVLALGAIVGGTAAWWMNRWYAVRYGMGKTGDISWYEALAGCPLTAMVPCLGLGALGWAIYREVNVLPFFIAFCCLTRWRFSRHAWPWGLFCLVSCAFGFFPPSVAEAAYVLGLPILGHAIDAIRMEIARVPGRGWYAGGPPRAVAHPSAGGESSRTAPQEGIIAHPSAGGEFWARAMTPQRPSPHSWDHPPIPSCDEAFLTGFAAPKNSPPPEGWPIGRGGPACLPIPAFKKRGGSESGVGTRADHPALSRTPPGEGNITPPEEGKFGHGPLHRGTPALLGPFPNSFLRWGMGLPWLLAALRISEKIPLPRRGGR